ncbi:MAG TPA: Ig-like domain-containing protein, partial [Mycobacterium sp.]|nr:Ig-like domain-containing protein [Mycobacterium sp.]
MAAGSRRNVGRSKSRHRRSRRAGGAQAVYPTFRIYPSPTGDMPGAGTSTGYAKHVGRVGALALALGVGMAVATGQGMGFARADDSPSVDSNSVPSGPSPTGESGDLNSPTPPSNTPTPTSSSSEPPSAPTNTPSVPEMNYDSSGGALTSGDEDKKTPPKTDPKSVPTVSSSLTAPTPTPQPKNNPQQGNSTPAAHPSATVAADSSEPPSSGDAPKPAEPTTTVTVLGEHTQARLVPGPNGGEIGATDSQQSPTASAMEVSALSAPQESTASPGIVDLTTTVLAAALAPFVQPGPGGAPSDAPVLLAVLAWARRETQRALGSGKPEVTPQQTTSAVDEPVATTEAIALSAKTTKAPAAKKGGGGGNTKPVATDDSYTTNEDNTLTIGPATGVLANDTDADGNSLSATLVSGPKNGTVNLNP